QSKVLEAMAMGRPVVASAQAFEGLCAKPGRDLIVAKNADEFVAGISRVWDEGLAHTLGASARESVQTLYDWSRGLTSLDAILSAVEDAGTQSAPVIAGSFSAVS